MPTLRRAPNEQELEKLIAIFLKAETDIINELGRLRSAGNADYHAVTSLERVQAILRQMESDAWTYAPQMVEKQFYTAHPEARRVPGESIAKHIRAYNNAAALTAEQHAIVDQLVANLMGEITDASVTVMATVQSALIGRIEPDVYRRVGLEQVAERGDAYAQYRMGQLYRDGPLLIPDSSKAKHWLTRAAEHGLPEAQYALGKPLLSDDWEVRDPDEGIRWLKQAVENGSHFAAYRLGKEYLEGNAVNKDTTRAADWFTKSAEAGNQYAQYMMGKLHLTGQCLPRDQARAMMWFSRSAAQGNPYAQFFLEQRNNLRPPSVILAVTQLLYHMSRIFQDNSVPPAVPTGQQVDRKLRRKIQEKKIAMGHKPDDHEEQWPEMTM